MDQTLYGAEVLQINGNLKYKVNDEIADIKSNWFFILDICKDKQKLDISVKG